VDGQKEVVITGCVRTAIGAFGGSLAGVAPTELAAKVSAEAIKRGGAAPADVGHVVFGQVIHSEPKDMYLSRVAAITAGIPEHVPALTLNRLCGSGMQAVVSAAQMIMLGDTLVALAGGAESMSRAPFASLDTRWGKRLGDAALTDMLTAALTDPFGAGHMGVTGENVASDMNISREQQDQLALLSQQRAGRAIEEGRFDSQILPVQVKIGREQKMFALDEHVRSDTTLERLGELKPAFREGGTVTAGNAAGLNDGAAALLLMSGEEAARRKIAPMARLVSYGHAGVAPSRMGLGPVPAVKAALARAGLTIGDIDVIESNEAFAAQACAVAQELNLPPEKTNPNGGAIALGHPVGATGAVILVKLIHELDRINGRYGLATMCIGGGQGIAVVVERV